MQGNTTHPKLLQYYFMIIIFCVEIYEMLPVHSLEQPLGCREGKWSVDSIEPRHAHKA